MTNRLFLAVAAAGGLLLAGCARQVPAAVPSFAADARACAVRTTGTALRDQAVACAEEFIARNGYTNAEP